MWPVGRFGKFEGLVGKPVWVFGRLAWTPCGGQSLWKLIVLLGEPVGLFAGFFVLFAGLCGKPVGFFSGSVGVICGARRDLREALQGCLGSL